MSETTATLTTYNVDTAHSGIRFWVKHLMISKVHGTLSGITGAVTVDPANPESATIDITIPLSTFSTGNEQRDGHVKSGDFLGVDEFPEMKYVSKSITSAGANTYKVVGDLTLHGVTKEVPLVAEVTDEIPSPFGGFKVGVNATGVVHRDEFGISYNQAMETGGVMLGKEIHIEIDLELDRAA